MEHGAGGGAEEQEVCRGAAEEQEVCRGAAGGLQRSRRSGGSWTENLLKSAAGLNY